MRMVCVCVCVCVCVRLSVSRAGDALKQVEGRFCDASFYSRHLHNSCAPRLAENGFGCQRFPPPSSSGTFTRTFTGTFPGVSGGPRSIFSGPPASSPETRCSPPRPALLSLLPSIGTASWAAKGARALTPASPSRLAHRVHAHRVRAALNTREAGKPAVSGGWQGVPARRGAAGSSCPAGVGSSAFAPAWATLVGSERAF